MKKIKHTYRNQPDLLGETNLIAEFTICGSEYAAVIDVDGSSHFAALRRLVSNKHLIILTVRQHAEYKSKQQQLAASLKQYKK